MAISLVTITNISNQIINVLYDQIPTAQSATSSGLKHTDAGLMSIVPSASATIEQNRVDQGQLASFRDKGLITTSYIN